MRSFIAIAALCAALSGQSALAGDSSAKDLSEIAKPFAEDGIYVPAGQTVVADIYGSCRSFTNHDKTIGFYFSPMQPNSWPSADNEERAPLEPVVTEAPCE